MTGYRPTYYAALFPGLCPECDERWKAGDLIQPIDDACGGLHWRHAVCPEGVEKPEGTVCPTCFLRRSLTGECGCDE